MNVSAVSKTVMEWYLGVRCRKCGAPILSSPLQPRSKVFALIVGTAVIVGFSSFAFVSTAGLVRDSAASQPKRTPDG
jgi:hypothetical protein